MAEAMSDSSTISFVSYFSFASKSKTSKADSYLVAQTFCDARLSCREANRIVGIALG